MTNDNNKNSHDDNDDKDNNDNVNDQKKLIITIMFLHAMILHL